MSLLYNVLFAWKTKSTHHKLAMDALRHLQSPYAEQWSNLFLTNIEPYLTGSKDPDKKFKDFRNHVLHVGDNYWGGAIKTSLKWYKTTVDHLREENWKEAIYSAGVLSHYYTDPIQPFHTGQSDEEGKVHRASEWSIAKSYEILQEILETELGGYPDVNVPSGANWLSVMVKEGAETSHHHYDYLVENYDLKKGKSRPKEGLDPGSQKRLASLIGYAAVGFSRILDKAFEEADVIPPRSPIGLHGVLASMTIPIFWVTKNMADVKERAIVTAIYNEIKETGQLVENLPEDDREIKKLYETEVLKKSHAPARVEKVEKPVAKESDIEKQPVQKMVKTVPVKKPPEKIVSKPKPVMKSPMRNEPESTEERPVDRFFNKATYQRENDPDSPEPVKSSPETRPFNLAPPEEKPVISKVEKTSPEPVLKENKTEVQKDVFATESAELKFYLSPEDNVVDAPSIGSKTAKRLKKMKILTVTDLLNADPEETSRKLNVWHIKPETIREWQLQAELNCQVPFIRGHDVQILVACEITTPEQILNYEPRPLLDTIMPYILSSEGQRTLRSCKEPDLEEVTNWITWAGQARPLRKAA